MFKELITEHRLFHIFTFSPSYQLMYVNDFLNYMGAVDWNEIYNETYTVDEKYHIFETLVHFGMTECIPTKTIVLSDKEKPWMTPVIKDLVNRRWRAFRIKDFVMYNHLKAKVKEEINRAKKRWAQKAQSSPKDLWKVTNTAVGRKTVNKLESLIVKFPGVQQAAEEINKAFASICDCKSDLTPYHSEGTNQPDWTLHFSVSSVEKLLSRLQPQKACGRDMIPTVLYKKASVFLAPPLAHIYNTIVQQHHIPSSWKLALVTPIPKVAQPSLEDLRPISLLPTPSKVFERLLANQLMPKFREAAGHRQHGGLQDVSTTTASIAIHDHVTKLMDFDDVQGAQIIAYDMSKAFDKLRHDEILKRIIKCGFPVAFSNLLTSYLSDRHQIVRINHTLSSALPTLSGVPQGSVLGPLLFNATTGGLEKLNADTEIVKFVDDITLIIPVYKNSLNEHVLQEHSNVQQWAKDLKLEINNKKTKTIYFKKTTFLVEMPDIDLVTQHKLLGIVWSNDLSWKPHIQFLSRIFNQRLYCLRVLRSFLQRRELIQIYNSLLRSLLEYCSPLFVGSPSVVTECLEKLQRRAHRTICGRHCRQGCLPALQPRRMKRAKDLFDVIKSHSHPLNALLPQMNSRATRFLLPLIKTNRRAASFIPFMSLHLNGFK